MDLDRLKIGTVDYLPVFIKGSDRYTSITLTGKSGVGKTSILSSWFESDCFSSYSKFVLEPTGFFSRDCYAISKGKAKYCSLEYPISLNPMQSGHTHQQISDTIVEAMNMVIRLAVREANKDMTVKMRAILDEAIKYCLEKNRKSLIHVRDHVKNLSGQGETRDGIISRLDFLLSDERMAKILCGNNSIDWGTLIEKGESLIVDCSGMSREKFIFIGNICTQGVKDYFRYMQPKDYKPLAMYIDEAHNFITPHIFDILKEGRKYKISAILATQDFATLDYVTARLMLNVGTIVSFRVGHHEAVAVAQEMNIDKSILQSLGKYEVAFKTPREQGIAKAPRPPYFRELEIKKVEPHRKSRGWFPLESYQTGGTTI